MEGSEEGRGREEKGEERKGGVPSKQRTRLEQDTTNIMQQGVKPYTTWQLCGCGSTRRHEPHYMKT